MPILLYVVESCPLLARQTLSFEFTLTRIFMKHFRTGSSKVNVKLVLGFLLPKVRYLLVLLAFCRSLLRLKIAYLFANDARRQLHNIFIQFGDNIKTTRQLRNAVFAKFFD